MYYSMCRLDVNKSQKVIFNKILCFDFLGYGFTGNFHEYMGARMHRMYVP